MMLRGINATVPCTLNRLVSRYSVDPPIRNEFQLAVFVITEPYCSQIDLGCKATVFPVYRIKIDGLPCICTGDLPKSVRVNLWYQYWYPTKRSSQPLECGYSTIRSPDISVEIPHTVAAKIAIRL